MSSITEDIFSKIHREFWERPYTQWGDKEWDHFYSKKYLEKETKQRSYNTYAAELGILINYLKPGREKEKALALRQKLETKASKTTTTISKSYSLRERRSTIDYNDNRILKKMNKSNTSEKRYTSQLLKEIKNKRKQSKSNEWTDEEPFDSLFSTPKVEAEKSLSQEKIEDSWNKCTLKKQVDDYLKILDEKMDRNTFFIDFNELYTAFMMQPSNEYQHQNNYELFWCQDLYKRMTLQFLRNRSVLKDKTASEFRYRDELVNHLLSTIFYDVEDAIWIDTGEIENRTRKRQRNFSKAENEREQLGDKHDGVIYMNVHGSKVEVGFFEVVGNALINDNSFKNDDLIKLLKECEYHFLSMHLINNMYVVDEYDAFILPNSSV
ncbi:hypothetical protein RhiirA5_475117 [Rhizophagus irregularis]|uniref:Uncharacterized protein n=1 Tax=Rhizophagus irregularis TaxID=588596 RepID=A0A2N0PQT5_9GLOM|nr:hypothetical protein RhiirA5_475117 [Rhizophagus irregularis]